MQTRITLFIFGLLLSLSASAQYIYTLPLNVNKMKYDSKRDVIYATIKGRDSKYANTFISINPYTGQIVNSLFVGSEPTEFEFTDDSAFVYICFDELAMVKKFNLGSFKIDQEIILGTHPSYGTIYGQDIATVPGHDSICIVSRKYKGVSPNYAGIGVYSNGKLLPKETPGHSGPEQIESTGSTTIYGYSTDNDVYTINIDVKSGASIISNNDVVYLKKIKYEKGLIFGNNGKVIDTKYNPPIQIGCYPIYTIDTYESYGIASDTTNNKVFFDKVKGNDVEIYSFNKSTYAKKDTFILSDIISSKFHMPEIADLIRYGKRGIATTVFDDYSFSDADNQLILVNNLSLIDTTKSIDKLHPDLYILDTVRIIKYDTVKIAYNDTLIFQIPSTGVDKDIYSEFKIYPNPTSQYLNVDISNQVNVQKYYLQIFNLNSQLQYSTKIYDENFTIDLSDFAKGTYVLRIVNQYNKSICDKKIIIN